jgi:dTDP-4-amino-4,6-dideoxygalactose transaminase
MTNRWPHYDEETRAAVDAVLASGRVNYWTGEHGRAFEREFADFHGAGHAIALANGTLALELALASLDLGPGDEVVVTPRSFVASVSAVVRVGATPVFADVDPDSGNLTPESVRAVLGPRTRAILAVHLGGWPCDGPGLRALADAHDLHLIEDCAQAHGARIDGVPVGRFGHVAAFSFCQDKIMSTAGEGGALLTDDDALAERLWSLKDHGKSRAAVEAPADGRGFRWVHESFGTNARMPEVQAAVGRLQLRRLPAWLARRRAIADALADALAPHPALRVPRPDPARMEHAHYRLYAYVVPEALPPSCSRDDLIAALNDAGVACMQGSCPEIYRERAFVDAGLVPEARRPVAARLGETSLAFLVHPTLDDAAVEHAVAGCARVLDALDAPTRARGS